VEGHYEGSTMENGWYTKIDDTKFGGREWRKGPNARKLEAVEPARFFAGNNESSRSLHPASRRLKRNVFRTCDALVQRLWRVAAHSVSVLQVSFLGLFGMLFSLFRFSLFFTSL
jgi:hypothetical protein